MRAATAPIAVLAVLLCVSGVFAAEYVVKKGDTLSGISRDQLGTATRWQEIAELNKLEHPYRIKVGQTLELPSDAYQRTGGLPPLPGLPGNWISDIKTFIFAIFVALFILWLFSVFCLRLGCWFALVNASLSRCMLLSLGIAALMVICGMITVLICAMAIHGNWRPSVPIVTAIILWIADIGATLLLAKHFLRCKWRSVITVFVMAHFVFQVIVLVLSVAFITVPSLAVLRQAATGGL